MSEQDSNLQFSIQNWRAWAPGIESEQDWRRWLAEGQCPAGDERADVSFLPPMQRRRLGPMARSVFHVIQACLDSSQDQVPMVFASRHGELTRSYSLLRSLARKEALSPKDFSLSVHNAILGLYSIQYGNREAVSALAAGMDSLPMALMEGASQASLSGRDCLVVWAEQSLPTFYRHYVPDDAPQICMAIHIAGEKPQSGGQAFQLQLASAAGGEDDGRTPSVGDETDVLRAVMGSFLSSEPARWRSGSRRWTLEPC